MARVRTTSSACIRAAVNLLLLQMCIKTEDYDKPDALGVYSDLSSALKQLSSVYGVDVAPLPPMQHPPADRDCPDCTPAKSGKAAIPAGCVSGAINLLVSEIVARPDVYSKDEAQSFALDMQKARLTLARLYHINIGATRPDRPAAISGAGAK